MAIYTVLFEKLYTILREKEHRRHNQFFFQIFEIFQMFKTTVELMFTTQKANTCSPWTACSVFDWKYLFWVNLIPKLKNISLSWNFVPRLIQICRIPQWCSLFFSTGKFFLGKFGPKNQNCQFKLKFCTRLIRICRIM